MVSTFVMNQAFSSEGSNAFFASFKWRNGPSSSVRCSRFCRRCKFKNERRTRKMKDDKYCGDIQKQVVSWSIDRLSSSRS
mmetsp:Transcript_14773/g.24591  ORF Transcript_14773/g.24591 Transcript_14773/m.24591 type:complete len:80 (+) Transcript_14773:736-975(+)